MPSSCANSWLRIDFDYCSFPGRLRSLALVCNGKLPRAQLGQLQIVGLRFIQIHSWQVIQLPSPFHVMLVIAEILYQVDEFTRSLPITIKCQNETRSHPPPNDGGITRQACDRIDDRPRLALLRLAHQVILDDQALK